jgi:hypothetical protein
MPTPEAYQKAVDLVCSAVRHDAEKNYVEAFTLYIESLQYFIPLVNGKLHLMISCH